MSEKIHRSGRSNWRVRERRLRAHYRKKIAIAVIVSLIVGMIGGGFLGYKLFNNSNKAGTDVTTTAAVTDAPANDTPALFATDAAEVTAAEETTAPISDATQAPADETTAAPAETTASDESDIQDLFGAIGSESGDNSEETTVTAAEWVDDASEYFDETAEIPETVEAAPTLAIGTESSEEDDVFGDLLTEETGSSEEEFGEQLDQLEAEAAETETASEEATAEPTTASSDTPTEEAAETPAESIVTEGTTEAPAEGTTTEETTETSTEEPAEEVTAEPTEEATAEPTAEPVTGEIVPYGTACTLTTDINSDGSAHTVDDGTPYEKVSLTLQVKKYLDFDYYDRTYGSKYNLKGGTAAVVLEMTLNGYTGTTAIVPQNFLLITFCNETGDVTTQGVQLIDAEISGNTGVMITSDVPATIYKRYYKEDAGGEMTYMVVTTYNEGVKKDYWFEIIIPPEMITPEPTADPNIAALTVGSRGDDVLKLQEKLIEAGYLEGTADGIYGTNTSEAVKLMQKQLGMEETGEADALFLTYLYMDTE